MKLKLFILTTLVVFTTFAQKDYNHKGIYTSLGYQVGLLSVDLDNNKSYSFKNIDNKINLSHSGIISGTYKTPFNAEIKLGYILSQNNIFFEGSTNGKNFKVNNDYYSHTVFLGAGYNIPVKDNFDFSLSLGSSLSFVKDENISKEEGDFTNRIIVTNNSIKKGNAFIIPEISVTRYLNNGDFISFGGKYNLSVNENFLEGSIQNISSKFGYKNIDYKTKNNCFTIYLVYGFKI